MSKVGNKHSIPTTLKHPHNGGSVKKPSLSSHFSKKGVDYPSLNVIEKCSKPILSDNLMKQNINSTFNEPSLSSIPNLKTSKESLCKSQVEYPVFSSSSSLPHEGSSKKIKQSAQNVSKICSNFYIDNCFLYYYFENVFVPAFDSN